MYVLSNSAVFPIAATKNIFLQLVFSSRKTLNVSFFLLSVLEWCIHVIIMGDGR